VQTLRILASLVVAAVAILAYAIWGRAGSERTTATTETSPVISASRLTEVQPVKAIQLEYDPPGLPPGPGLDLFAAQCVVCHSPRYVLNQPIFPRKTWTAEVHKMVKAYGAPIDPSQEKEIVNYLVSWHGKDDPPAIRNPSSK
jgi:mono/diheme cytochrome c family protein